MLTARNIATSAACVASAIAFLLAPACGGKDPQSTFPGAPGNPDNGSSNGSSGSNTNLGGASSSSGASSGGGPCVGLQCQQVKCTGGATTTLTGHIYDPAGNNPLYKVVAYIPNSNPEPINDGVSSASCGCDSLYTGQPIAAAITDATGSFTLNNAPSGSNIPIVIQIGKWRNYFTIPNVTQCQSNDLDTLLPAKLTLPKTQTETAYSNIPSIAVSTGGADSMECVFARIGVDESEYTGDPTSTTQHIHIFQGAGGHDTVNPAGPSSPGPGGLWDTDTDINRYDITVLSCEGADTTDPNSQVLADYVNGGGRVFASHYHYAFFFNDQTNTNSPQFPNVANWNLAYEGAQPNGSDDYTGAIGATISTTLANGSPFPEGQALYTWLKSTINVLGTNGMPANDLEIDKDNGRYDGIVGAGNVSTVWAAADPATLGGQPVSDQYFSWDMPFNAPLDDAGVPGYCGRVVFSDLHVGAASNDYTAGGAGKHGGTVPTGCSYPQKLAPDEDAIEFILFDLSSCVTPVSGVPQPPPTPTGPIQ